MLPWSKDVEGRVGFKFGKPGAPFFIRAGVSSGGGKDTENHTYSDAVFDVVGAVGIGVKDDVVAEFFAGPREERFAATHRLRVQEPGSHRV